MNKNGFIATSLIYSFFLIFVTLFLTIIADYLQNKVLLNTIEKGIKDEINSTMSIEDFEVGDILFISEDIGIGKLPKDSNWIVSNVIFDYDKSERDTSKVVLYNVVPEEYTEDFPDYCLKNSDIKKDLINFGNFNDTRLNELLYSSNEDYNIYVDDEESSVIKSIKNNCAIINDSTIDYSGCNDTIDPTKCRERFEYELGNKKFKINPDSGAGLITVTGVVS